MPLFAVVPVTSLLIAGLSRLYPRKSPIERNSPGREVWAQDAGQEPRLRRCGPCDQKDRNGGERRDLQQRGRRPAEAVAVQGGRPDGAGPRKAAGGRQERNLDPQL